MREGVGFHHATLTQEGLGVRVAATPEHVLGPPDRPEQAVLLTQAGESVRVGPCTLTLVAPAAEDPVLELEEDAQGGETEALRAGRYLAAFDVRLPNVRLMGTGLVCAILALLFAWPLSAPAGAGALWSVGRMSRAHAGFGADCARCHTAAFAHASSQSCLACHAGVGQHASPVVAPAADIAGRRCEDCHLEHKGAVMAVRNRDGDCDTCHAHIKGTAPHTQLRDVSAFGDAHPQFKVALVQDAVLRKTARFSIGDEHAPDGSNLAFTHATHLKLADLRAADGGGKCGLCHVASLGGSGFKPVGFEAACASCHTLQFDPDHPEWRLPHGHADEVQSRVSGYYAKAVLAGETFFRPPADLFRRPGAPPDAPRPAGTALVTAMTAQAMAGAIARSACGECHRTVMRSGDTWAVAPVFVPDSYLPGTKFSHASHAASACTLCHAAKVSDGGPTAMLPGIDTCRQCHAPKQVSEDCALCHTFHDPKLPLETRK